MRASAHSAIAVVALLVLAGCAGLPGMGESDPSPDASPADFPNASAIDQSVFDTHATALANTSFTLTYEKIQKDRAVGGGENFSYENETTQYLVEPGASQYLAHTNSSFRQNSVFYLNVTYYSNGKTTYGMSLEDNESTVSEPPRFSPFNESDERYLWGGWFGNDSSGQFEHAAVDAAFQREGVETFQGVPVMRYEATDVDALADSWVGTENLSSYYEEFSATLLLDEDGVIRHYEYEFVWAEYGTRMLRESYTLSDVGSTDVEEPDWAENGTTES